MKTIYAKRNGENFFVHNKAGEPAIILIFPITRDCQGSSEKWTSAINFVKESNIDSFIVIDKTSESAATKYFMENFNSETTNLYVLPRSIKESHYESLGAIELDDNFWVMQLHDDDDWSGSVTLPEIVDQTAAYYSKFFMTNRSRNYTEQFDFSTPGRINFVLIPSHIWNQFSSFIKNQNYHVAGSLDSTLNQMVQLSCALLHIPDFSYFYDNSNWETRKSSRKSLIKLVKHDGWGNWASVEIALFSRLLDNLTSIAFVVPFATPSAIQGIYVKLMKQFKPRLRRRILLRFKILGLRAIVFPSRYSSHRVEGILLREYVKSRYALAVFIRDSWSTENLSNVIELIDTLENSENFSILRYRFNSWKLSLSNLTKVFGT